MPGWLSIAPQLLGSSAQLAARRLSGRSGHLARSRAMGKRGRGHGGGEAGRGSGEVGHSAFRSKLEAYKARVLTSSEDARPPAKRSKAAPASRGRDSPAQRSKAPSAGRSSDAGQAGHAGNKRQKKQKGKKFKDPSAQYLANPKSAPVCGEAARFVRSVGWKKPFKIVLGRTGGWRTTAKLSVRGTPPVVGMFAPGSHDIVPLLHSVAHHPSINALLPIVSGALEAHGVKGYDGINPGGVSYVCMNVETSSAKVQLVLVFNSAERAENAKDTKAVLDAIRASRQGRKLLHSLWHHCNPATRYENNIFSYKTEAWHLEHGPSQVAERMTALEEAAKHIPTLKFAPFVFRQANTEAFVNIIAEVRRWVKPGSRVVELYGGVGTIGLHVLDRVSSLVCSDENTHNEQCFNASLAQLPEATSRKASYRPANAATMARSGALDDADLCIVDPPRKGMEDVVLHHVAASPRLTRLVYVSCGFKAFQRDCATLLDQGFRLAHCEGHLLFPGSNHLETVAIFDRDVAESRRTSLSKS